MTFSQFAQVLYTYLRNGKKEEDFVVELTNQIMGGRPGRAHSDGTYQNPMLSKEARSRIYYFSGERLIPQKDASIILSSIDKYKFEQYLKKYCSEDALSLLKKDLAEIEALSDGDVVEICADLFEQILHDLAKK